MNMFSPAEIAANYSAAGAKKADAPAGKLLVLGVLAGLAIGFGGAAAAAATFAVDSPSLAKLISGLVFPFGLGIVILTGAELFTGNCLISISVLDGATGLKGLCRNLALVYLGNFAGAVLLAAGCAFGRQMDMGGGALAVSAIATAASKCAIPFGKAVIMGLFCNVLVCVAVLCAQSAEDTAGRIMGAYIPVALFVICGFEHCVANMYYIPAGLFAAMIPDYAALAADAGLELSGLSWKAFLLSNLIPVTIGNIMGGFFVGGAFWYSHIKHR